MKKLIFTFAMTFLAVGLMAQKIGNLDVAYPSDVDSTSRILINANPSGNKLESQTVGSFFDAYVGTYGANLNDYFPAYVDTVPLVTFGAGAGLTADTALFNNNVLIGSFFNDGSDVSITTPVHSTGTFSGKIGKVNGKWGIVR